MSIERLQPQGPDFVNVIVETPRGSRTKYKYDPATKLFIAHKFLPYGMFFPVDFGFIPSTCGEDGDPLDVVLLMQEPAHVGCLVHGRVLGVMEGRQTEKGKGSFRNDRLVAVPAEDPHYKKVQALADLNSGFLEQLERFFVEYNRLQGRGFKPLGIHGPPRANRLLKAGMDGR